MLRVVGHDAAVGTDKHTLVLRFNPIQSQRREARHD
jgi:hypothetical protein